MQLDVSCLATIYNGLSDENKEIFLNKITGGTCAICKNIHFKEDSSLCEFCSNQYTCSICLKEPFRKCDSELCNIHAIHIQSINPDIILHSDHDKYEYKCNTPICNNRIVYHQNCKNFGRVHFCKDCA